jgi:hypothetical protein
MSTQINPYTGTPLTNPFGSGGTTYTSATTETYTETLERTINKRMAYNLLKWNESKFTESNIEHLKKGLESNDPAVFYYTVDIIGYTCFNTKDQ